MRPTLVFGKIFDKRPQLQAAMRLQHGENHRQSALLETDHVTHSARQDGDARRLAEQFAR